MYKRRYQVKSKIEMPGGVDYEVQAKDLNETFDGFHLLKYRVKKIGGSYYNVFTFYHNISINVTHSEIKNYDSTRKI